MAVVSGYRDNDTPIRLL